MQASVEQLAAELIQQKWQLAVAESCTGGLIAAKLTAIAGSSRWFERGFVTYSNEAKKECLGVPTPILQAHGAVSAQTAQAMAEGALVHSWAQLAMATTGIAGPSGGSANKPVGLVWFAWKLPDVKTVVKQQIFTGSRQQIQQQAAGFAIDNLIQLLSNYRHI